LALPDDPGNRLYQSLSNLASNPRVGLVFFIPGIEETARVNGRARLLSLDRVEDAASAGEGPPGESRPRRFVRVAVEECYYHCGRAVRGARLWGARALGAALGAPRVPPRPQRLHEPAPGPP